MEKIVQDAIISAKKRYPHSPLARALSRSIISEKALTLGGVVFSFRTMQVCRSAVVRLEKNGIAVHRETPVSFHAQGDTVLSVRSCLAGRFIWTEVGMGFPEERLFPATGTKQARMVEPAKMVAVEPVDNRNGCTDTAIPSMLPSSGGLACGPDSRHKPISGKPVAHLA